MKPISKIHLENQTVVADVADLEQIPDLPVLNFIDSALRAKLKVFFVIVSLIGIIWGMFGISLFWNNPKLVRFFYWCSIGGGRLWCGFDWYIKLFCIKASSYTCYL